MNMFACNICKVTRTDSEGSGEWYTLGINDYGGGKYRQKKLHVYGWPLGSRSQQDELVQHACSVTHLIELVKQWTKADCAAREGERP
jgi:hypothetical protein